MLQKAAGNPYSPLLFVIRPATRSLVRRLGFKFDDRAGNSVELQLVLPALEDQLHLVDLPPVVLVQLQLPDAVRRRAGDLGQGDLPGPVQADDGPDAYSEAADIHSQRPQ